MNQSEKSQDRQNKYLVCTSIDDNYFWPWLVMVYSAVTNSKKRNFRFILANINGLLSQSHVEIAKQFVKVFQIELEVINLESSMNPVFEHQFNMTVYSRLFLMDLLDEDFLWLDADLLLLPDWDQIFEESGDKESNGVVLYGVLDSEITRSKLSDNKNRAFIRSQGRYVNCGVIKISIKPWKNISSKNSWQEIAENLEIHGLTLNDQDVLNLLCAGKISLLPEGFNHIVGDERSLGSRIYVWHYAGSPKPWQLDESGKEFLMGIQGTNYLSPKDWLTQSRDAFTYYPMYWKAESELLAFLKDADAKLMLEILRFRKNATKSLDKRSRMKLLLMRVVTKNFSI